MPSGTEFIKHEFDEAIAIQQLDHRVGAGAEPFAPGCQRQATTRK